MVRDAPILNLSQQLIERRQRTSRSPTSKWPLYSTFEQTAVKSSKQVSAGGRVRRKLSSEFVVFAQRLKSVIRGRVLDPCVGLTSKWSHILFFAEVCTQRGTSRDMHLRRYAALLITLIATVMRLEVPAQRPNSADTEPEITSVFPLVGKQGSSGQFEVRGSGLEGTYAVWFDCENARTTVKEVQPADLDAEKQDPRMPGQAKKPKKRQRVLLDVRFDSRAATGSHTFRLVSNRGVSNALSLFVTAENVVMEQSQTSSLLSEFQRVNWPAMVAGRIGEQGEVDYYSVEVPAGRDLLLEVDSLGGSLDPVITLFEPSGSWLNSERLKQLAFNDDKSSRSAAGLSYHFKKSGRYVVGVAGFVGLGGPDFSYQLRIADSSAAAAADSLTGRTGMLAHPISKRWQERDFARKLEANRLNELGSRTVKPLNAAEAKRVIEGSPALHDKPNDGAALSIPVLPTINENEPNDRFTAALNLSIPAIVEGAIGRAGDVDCFKMKVDASQSIAFEIQTEDTLPPFFNPRLELWTLSGEEVLTNVYQRIGGDGDDWVQSLEPKVIHTFDQGGEYYLKLRDLTSRNGSPSFTYRLLLRAQTPHVGDVEIKEDRFNLATGQARTLTLSVAQEEGFDGQIAVRVEDLPSGVIVLPAADVAPAQGPPFAKVHPERFLPRNQIVTLILVANADAPITRMPSWAKVKVQPIVSGQLGTPFLTKELAIMVVDSSLRSPDSVGEAGKKGLEK